MKASQSLLVLSLIASFSAAASTFHIRTDGSDSACNGSANTPAGSGACAFKTIQKGVDSLTGAGDRIIIHSGTYPEYVQINSSHPNGIDGNPIIIEGDPAVDRSTIVLDGSGFVGTLLMNGSGGSSTKVYYVLQHFAFKTGNTQGIEIGTFNSGYAAKVILRDVECHSINFVQPTFYNSRVITGSTWNGGPYGDNANILIDDVEIDNSENGGAIGEGVGVFLTSGNSILRNSSIQDLHALGRMGNNVTVEFNRFVFSDCESDEGCLQLYNGFGLIYRYNTMKVTDNIYVPNYRLIGVRELQNAANPFASAVIENNVFEYEGTTQPSYAIVFDQGSQYGVVNNNVFIGFDNHATSGAIGIVPANCADFEVKYNAFYNSFPTRSDKPGCMAQVDATNLANTSTIDFDTTTYLPDAGSRLIDAGDPDLSVPTGGGTLSDIGAYESGAGATWPYDFQSRANVPSGTAPVLSWGLAQAGFQCQIDTALTFDSQGRGVPVYDSGFPPNSDTAATTCGPASALSNGTYFARVRFRNGNPNLTTAHSAWSDSYFKFTVGGTSGSATISIPPSYAFNIGSGTITQPTPEEVAAEEDSDDGGCKADAVSSFLLFSLFGLLGLKRWETSRRRHARAALRRRSPRSIRRT